MVRKAIKERLSFKTDVDRKGEIEQLLKVIPFNELSNNDLTFLSDYVLKGEQFTHDELKGEFWTFSDLPLNDRDKFADVEDLTLMEPYAANAPTNVTTKSRLKRSDVLNKLRSTGANEQVVQQWFNLWSRIDYCEYVTQKGDILTGKRVKEIRPQLLKRLTYSQRTQLDDEKTLTPDELQQYLAQLDLKASQLTPSDSKMLKLDLVRLRKEQYDLLDVLKESTPFISNPKEPQAWFDDWTHVQVLPVDRPGVPYDEWDAISIVQGQKMAQGLQHVDPEIPTIDLRKVEVMRQVIQNYDHILTLAEKSEVAKMVIDYVDLYADKALTQPHLHYILKQREHGVTIPKIKENLQELYGKTYSTSYLYTIFTKQILIPMCAVAHRHGEIIRLIAEGISNFKRCKECHKWKPRNNTFFYVRSGNDDGFIGTCKECTKAKKL